MSKLKDIIASIIQGSLTRPVSYVINAGDLTTVSSSSKTVKFADDTYLLILASNVDLRTIELVNVETWARANNLMLNNNKTKEIIFIDRKQWHCAENADPLELHAIAWVTSLTVLEVTWTNGLLVS
jgi:hypothetical protein